MVDVDFEHMILGYGYLAVSNLLYAVRKTTFCSASAMKCIRFMYDIPVREIDGNCNAIACLMTSGHVLLPVR